MKRLEKACVILCICYIAAYILAAGIENYEIKNQYEKQKIQGYEQIYYNNRRVLK